MLDQPRGEGPAETAQDAEKKKKRKKDKVRSAWISFIGRIVAQVVGAVATVVLGVMVLQTYSGHANSAAALAAPHTLPPSSAAGPSRDIFVAVLPIENFSGNPARAGKRVRITVQLIGSDDSPVADALALQAEVASAIARAVSTASPSRREQRLLARIPSATSTDQSTPLDSITR